MTEGFATQEEPAQDSTEVVKLGNGQGDGGRGLPRLTNTGLPDGLSSLSQLKAIGLKRNKLTEVPRVLGSLTALQEIYLEDNVNLEVLRPAPAPPFFGPGGPRLFGQCVGL